MEREERITEMKQWKFRRKEKDKWTRRKIMLKKKIRETKRRIVTKETVIRLTK